jgi:hypothetical protein
MIADLSRGRKGAGAVSSGLRPQALPFLRSAGHLQGLEYPRRRKDGESNDNPAVPVIRMDAVGGI